ncbi:MAG: 6-carboxytetrahydropterin synthase QueD [Candidatus Muirbacterium halophilum]|nr:6-carboxytetrahydropterin synthase QueD [Candidatus Muirbacterium halophilum]MCK9474740.1 6-carboxytetrahydropterin synthase QueD [Candidatus Muirbacterium halophilum]
MYFLGVKSDFSSAHYLRDYNGKCSNLHGHNWIVEAVFVSKKLDKAYLSVDFTILKKILKEVMYELDHKCLNEIEYFKIKNPTAEVISEFIYNNISEKVQELDINADIYEIKVWESEKSWVSYKKD